MHTTLLVVHIVGMIASLCLMSSAVLLGLNGKALAVRLASVGMGITIVGGISGIALLFSAPLSLKCALLTAYLLAMTALYIFGFGSGRVAKARLIRHSAAIQKS